GQAPCMKSLLKLRDFRFVQGKRYNMAEPITDDAFARYINLIGNASIDQIEAAKSAQADAAKNGTTVTLADVLVKQGVLTPAIKANVEKKLLEMQEGCIEHESGPHQIGNYKLLKKLGEGGMGAVYLADDSMAGRKV